MQAAAALQRAQARGRVVELVKGESWPREWGNSYVPLQLVAERASGSRDDVISALRGELKGLIHTVQARGATARVTHMVPMAIADVRVAPETFFFDSARGTRRQIRWPGGAAIDVCAAGTELANEGREPYQSGGHESFANGGLCDSPSRPPRLGQVLRVDLVSAHVRRLAAAGAAS